MATSEDITFTYAFVTGATATFTFAGVTTQNCKYSINGAATVDISMNNFFVPLPSGAAVTLKISNVSASGITGFTMSANVVDNLTAVSTGNTATWGLGGTLNSFAGTFQNAVTLTSVPAEIPSTVLNLSNMFNNCPLFNQNISSWSVKNVTNMSGMFQDCNAFNNGGLNAPLWPNATLTSVANVTDMSNMFNGCIAFNVSINSWVTSSVTTMAFMFYGCNLFDQNITSWDTSNVVSMSNMFGGGSSPVFNQNIRYWVVRSTALLSNMFTNPSAMATTYYNKVDTASTWGPSTGATPSALTTPLYGFFNQPLPERYPCFMKGTQILCLRAEEEVYRSVQDLRKGDLVKTYRNGYLPIHMIGTSRLSNPGDDERTTNRLYKCSKELYPGLFEDLYITGCHSILVPALTNDQWENTKDMLGNVYITDNHFRLMACVDEKAQPFQKDAMIDIYHIALENQDYYMNYGIYANGLLVESCSKRYLTELSNMRIIGEDEACYDAPSVNVFSELGAFVQTF